MLIRFTARTKISPQSVQIGSHAHSASSKKENMSWSLFHNENTQSLVITIQNYLPGRPDTRGLCTPGYNTFLLWFPSTNNKKQSNFRTSWNRDSMFLSKVSQNLTSYTKRSIPEDCTLNVLDREILKFLVSCKISCVLTYTCYLFQYYWCCSCLYENVVYCIQ